MLPFLCFPTQRFLTNEQFQPQAPLFAAPTPQGRNPYKVITTYIVREFLGKAFKKLKLPNYAKGSFKKGLISETSRLECLTDLHRKIYADYKVSGVTKKYSIKGNNMTRYSTAGNLLKASINLMSPQITHRHRHLFLTVYHPHFTTEDHHINLATLKIEVITYFQWPVNSFPLNSQ